jgi:hypothetical protein
MYGVEERKKLRRAVGVVCFGISNNYTMHNTEDQHCFTTFFLQRTATKMCSSMDQVSVACKTVSNGQLLFYLLSRYNVTLVVSTFPIQVGAKILK